MKNNISPAVIKRLPRYYRFLGDLKAEGLCRISSGELSKRMGFTASQIRQDLNCFGGFGQQGYGYNIEMLQAEIGKILGLETPLTAIIIGAGNLGRALATQINFANRGYELIGVFDVKESVIGQSIKDMPIRSMEDLDDFCKEYNPDVAVLCIPKDEAVSAAYKLVKLGIKGFLNFTHYDLGLIFKDVAVENVHFGDSLMVLSYNINNKKK